MTGFDTYHLLIWVHFAALAVAIGGAVAALLISGLEGSSSEYEGLAAALWAKQVRWALRIAVLVGMILLALWIQRGAHPIAERFLHLKIPIAILALILSEMAPRALAARKHGAALLALVLLLVAGFMAINRGGFQPKGHANSGQSRLESVKSVNPC